MSPDRRRRRRFVAETLEARQLLATITVTSAGDADGADGGMNLSLRQAIEISNGALAIAGLSPGQSALVVGALTSPNTIDFAIPGPGPSVIQPASALPAITSPVVIDGYTEAGAHPNTNGPSEADNAVIQVELDGSKAGNASSGLDLEAAGSTVQGLAIGGFSGVENAQSLDFGNDGIYVGRPGRDLIEGDFLGLDASGSTPLPNNRGISIDDTFNQDPTFVTIGGTTAAARNVLSGNLDDGLVVDGSNNLIEGNLVGLDAAGDRAVANGQSGYGAFIAGLYDNGSFNTIGGTTPGARNVLSGNETGLSSFFGSGNLMEGNFVGTDVTGTKAVGNLIAGISIEDGGPNTIGGTAAGAGNVISGNTAGDTYGDYDIGLYDAGPGDLIEGNLIGLDASGTSPLPNGTGIEIQGMSQTVGGIVAGSGNLIEDNAGIGFNDDGTADLIAANVISGNGGAGLDERGTDELVVGNFIGSDATGTRPMGNLGAGVSITGTSNTIGGTAAGFGNVIADNQGDGVAVAMKFIYNDDALQFEDPFYLVQDSGQFDRISGNQVFGNHGLGIDLLDSYDSFQESGGPSFDLMDDYPGAIKPGDPPGANGLMAAPVIESVTPDGAGSLISGRLDAAPSETFAVELFADPDGLGQGKTYLGTVLATSDATGHASFAFDLTAPIAGQSVTATATGPSGDTSEFSNDIQPDSTTTRLVGPAGLVVIGQSITLVATVAPASGGGTPSGRVDFTEDGAAVGSADLDASGSAWLTLPALGDTHAFAATFEGSAGNPGSASNEVFVTAPKQPTQTRLSIPGTQAIGLPIMLVATVSPAQPGGVVDFFEDGQVIGSATLDASSSASLTITTFNQDPHTFAAAYLGSALADGSTSAPILVTASKLATTTLTGPSLLITLGQAVTLTATVATSLGGVPEGTVAFFVDGTLEDEVPVDASGKASFSPDGLGPGPHAVRAMYLGDAIDAPSLSEAQDVGVLPIVAAGGPTVTSLASPTLGSVVVTFSRALLASTAQDLANYAIIGPDGQAVAIESADYDPTDDAVTLTVRHALKAHTTYKVTVNGKRVGRVDDADGVPCPPRRGLCPAPASPAR